MTRRKFDIGLRLHLIDEIRGFCIICMVFYHALYSLEFIFYDNTFSRVFDFLSIFEPGFAFVFIIISGFCCELSRSNILRGARLFVIAMLITLVTYLFFPEQIIVFGILHMLSISMVLYGILKPVIAKIPEILGIIICLTLFVLTFKITLGKIGPFSLPLGIYKYNFLFPVGICSYKFYSADYFPLLPWVFIFFLGSFIGSIGIKRGFAEFMYIKHSRLLSFAGRNTLLIYIIHQPVIYVIIWFIELLIMIRGI